MSHMTIEQRKARDAAFAQMMKAGKPGYALRQQMVQARVRAGLTQSELASLMRTSQPAIARMENGGRSPNIKTLERLARTTGSRLVVRLEALENSGISDRVAS